MPGRRGGLEIEWFTGVVEADHSRPRLEQVYAARITPLSAADPARPRELSVEGA